MVHEIQRKVIDHRWLKPVEELYAWHYQNERYLRNEQSLARVAMVYSQQTASFYGGEHAHAKVEDHALGFYQALVEARIPFDMVHDRLLDADHVGRYRTLILPNIAALSAEQCRQLAEFVRNGGSLVATHETSLYDEWGVRRKRFRTGGVIRRIVCRPRRPARSEFVSQRGEGSANRQVSIRSCVGWKTRRESSTARSGSIRGRCARGYSPLTLVPSYPDLPMEEVYPRVPRTDIPGVYAREEGRGRVVYFPFDIDRTFWEVLSADHWTVLRNAVAWASNEEQPLVVQGKGVLDVSLWMQKDSMTAHLVNLTNPMMMKGPVREIIPSPPQQLRIRVPDGRRVSKVSLLVSGRAPGHRISGNVVSLEIPSIDLHEVVALDLT